ncbi:MAG: xanthine dehydrogenase family protein molybdopterin-binding subunit [Candidatus Riflebacteria bacterium]|nr:xanthine dehydrogenase family protein molybdopterin-binding subunit [Candidatus Riflebacteria bacterium]
MPAVGASLPRKDALDKLKGVAKYIDDYNFSDILHVVTVRSQHAYGRLINIDKTEAEKMPGVAGVITASQIPGVNAVPLVFNDEPFLAEGFVRFHGEPVALVAAETLEQAQAAAALVKIEVEPLKPVLSIRESLAADAPRIYKENNTFSHFRVAKGNAEEAMKTAAHVFEQEYETPYQEHAYLETNGVIAVPGLEDSMTVYGSMQCPYYVHDAVVAAAGISKNKARVIQTTTGGGFGGKEDFPSVIAGQATAVAKIFNRPAKLIYKREEDIIASSKRHPGLIKMKVGTDEKGKIVAAIIDYYVDGGAYATLTPIVLWRGTVHALGPYECENIHVNSYGVATNKVPCGAYRGFGSPQVIFAGESLIDEIAVALNIDPLEIRRTNGYKLGSKTATGQLLDQSCGLMETIEKAGERSQWASKWQKPAERQGNIRRGIGISSVYYGVGLGAGGKHLDRVGTSMTIMKDGSVHCAIGNVEMGQGARTVLAQIAADALGAPFELVNVVETDTSMVPDSGPTVASRTTFMSGNSLMLAAAELRPRLLQVAAKMLDAASIADVDLIDGKAFLKNQPDKKQIGFKELAEQLYVCRLMPSAFGWFVAPDSSYDNETGQGNAYFVYSYSTNIAEVEVDMETGEYKVVRITSAHDMGKAINPQQVEGQIEGGTLQGLGYATMEEIRHDGNGRMLNNAFATYILPTTEDTPEIDPIIVEHPYDRGPYGAKGFGEVPLMGIAPAISNAIYNATGVRIRKLPVKPEKILGLED